jgi:undecaprenyl-diphosphatase
MKKKSQVGLCVAICSVSAFAVWTLLVRFVDVRAIGPLGSTVGFAALNGYVHDLIGVNMSLYVITDWLGLVPIATALGFAILGLVQWINRKSIWKVDHSILALGVFYVVVIAVYLLFEFVEVNYRPVLIDGYLEVSYPSSTTMLVMCVMPTAAMQMKARIKNCALRRCVLFAIIVFVAFTVVGRLLSGVHWITDIIGGALISIGLVITYKAFGRF